MAATTTKEQLPLVPTPFDGVQTETSTAQQETEETISSILRQYGRQLAKPASTPSTDDEGRVQEIGAEEKGWEDIVREEEEGGVKKAEEVRLEREKHIAFLAGQLATLPAGYVALDASRPWLLFWAVNGLDILDCPLDPTSRRRAVSTLLSFQHPHGGFGGGPGQVPHLAPTYAAVSALVCLAGDMDGLVGDEHGEDGMRKGGVAAEEVWEKVDRKGMYGWMMRLKQDDGSFVMHEGGEVDVRGCYCCIVVATLLDLLTPELVRGTAEFIASCQTYEGGLASASHPFLTSSPPLYPPLGEAHGGYTSCAVLCHFLLRPLTARGEKGGEQRKELDVAECLRWAANMQALPIEGGGFRGRTNKLVDGCYSWWCAGLFPVLEALLSDDPRTSPGDDSEALFDRTALQEYTLLVAQSPYGGLRDKPGKPSDAYHTHYNLCGLSTAQRRIRWSSERAEEVKRRWKAKAKPEVGGESWKEAGGAKGEEWEEVRKEVYAMNLAWEENVPGGEIIIGDRGNKVAPIHPCFLVRPHKVKKVLDYFYGQL